MVTAGVALLVYGLSRAGTDQASVSHWADTSVVTSLGTAVVLLLAFVLCESRNRDALMPLRIFAATAPAPT